MERKKTLKKYLQPKIVYEKEIEVLSAVCDTVWGDMGLLCKTAAPCMHLLS